MKTEWYKTMVKRFADLSKEIESMQEYIIQEVPYFTSFSIRCLTENHHWVKVNNPKCMQCIRCGTLVMKRFKIYP